MLAKTQNNGDAIIISTKEPYLHVEAILDYTDECEGEDEDEALEIARKRFAKGEIDEETFDKIKQKLR